MNGRFGAGQFKLTRNTHGRLVFGAANGEVHEGVVPVRAFPIADPEHGIALVSPDGHELAWVESLAELPEDQRQLIVEELARREFMPEIRRLLEVSSFATPSTWQVETDRGTTRFVLKGEEDIRRIAHYTLLIADSHGIHFLIRDIQKLDKPSRKLLDRFL
ncbi:MAG: DUF1854 domain-containing protein [Rhodocyclaceae bacterium]|nr:DUF1854 domain-containing protein [Rhodocyclaceae bacterium]MBX3669781.1 DUF1854 domain-containing protein [Rhodocyclaceae bacterium]